jgi:Holliday junction resolvase RusA-like endonuclease
MADPFELWVPGYPRSKQSMRFKGKHSYQTKGIKTAQQLVRHLYEEGDGPVFDNDAGLAVDIEFSPEGTLVVISEAGRPGCMRADVDNMVKLVLDGMQMAYKGDAFNDRRVVDLHAAKYPKGHHAGRILDPPS